MVELKIKIPSEQFYTVKILEVAPTSMFMQLYFTEKFEIPESWPCCNKHKYTTLVKSFKWCQL